MRAHTHAHTHVRRLHVARCLSLLLLPCPAACCRGNDTESRELLEEETLRCYLALVRQAFQGSDSGSWNDSGRKWIQELVQVWKDQSMPVDRLVNTTQHDEKKWTGHIDLEASSGASDTCEFKPYDWWKRKVHVLCTAVLHHFRKEFVMDAGNRKLRSGQGRKQAVARLYVAVWGQETTAGVEWLKEHGAAFAKGETTPDWDHTARTAKDWCWQNLTGHGAAVIDVVGEMAHDDDTLDVDFDVSTNADKGRATKGKKGSITKGSRSTKSRVSMRHRKKEFVADVVNRGSGSSTSRRREDKQAKVPLRRCAARVLHAAHAAAAALPWFADVLCCGADAALPGR